MAGSRGACGKIEIPPPTLARRGQDLRMEIRIESLLEGAHKAAGAVAVIDMFRAFTTAAVAFARGARQIVMVGTVDRYDFAIRVTLEHGLPVARKETLA